MLSRDADRSAALDVNGACGETDSAAPQIVVRPMKPADTEAICRIMADCYHMIARTDGIAEAQLHLLIEERCSPASVSALMTQFACFVAAEPNGVVGIVSVGGGMVGDLFVAPGRHRTGVGSALFRHAEQLLRTAGHSEMTLTTTGYGIPFYRAMGMQVAGATMVPFGPLEGATLVKLTKLLLAPINDFERECGGQQAYER